MKSAGIATWKRRISVGRWSLLDDEAEDHRDLRAQWVFAPPCVARIGPRRLPSECNLEDRTLTIGSAKESRPVEIAVRVLNQGAFGFGAVGTRRAEGVQHRFHARGCDLEYRTRSQSNDAIGAAGTGCPIKIAIRALNQTGNRKGGVRARRAEGIQNGFYARRRDLVNRTQLLVRAVEIGGPVEIAVRAHNKPP